MSNPYDAPNDLAPISDDHFIADPNAAPVNLGDIMREMNLAGDPVAASELKGQRITILRAKPYESNLAEGKKVYFVIARVEGREGLVQTSLGGKAVVEILDLYTRSGQSAPLSFILEWIEGGEFNGYWQPR